MQRRGLRQRGEAGGQEGDASALSGELAKSAPNRTTAQVRAGSVTRRRGQTGLERADSRGRRHGEPLVRPGKGAPVPRREEALPSVSLAFATSFGCKT